MYDNYVFVENEKHEEEIKDAQKRKDEYKFDKGVNELGTLLNVGKTAIAAGSTVAAAKRAAKANASIKEYEKKLADERGKEEPDQDRISYLKKMIKKFKLQRALYSYATGVNGIETGQMVKKTAKSVKKNREIDDKIKTADLETKVVRTYDKDGNVEEAVTLYDTICAIDELLTEAVSKENLETNAAQKKANKTIDDMKKDNAAGIGVNGAAAAMSGASLAVAIKNLAKINKELKEKKKLLSDEYKKNNPNNKIIDILKKDIDNLTKEKKTLIAVTGVDTAVLGYSGYNTYRGIKVNNNLEKMKHNNNK